jgi:DNA repair exonuclease SbcCD ATPase subunit
MVERYGSAELWADLLVWRHDDPSAYSCGTDAERKRLTELLVPTLAGFDAGLERCADRRKAHARGSLAESAAAVAAAGRAKELAEQELQRVLALPDTADDPVMLRGECARVESRRAALHQRVAQLDQQLRTPAVCPELPAVEQQLRDARYREQQASDELRRCGDGTCPTCRRPLGDPAEAARARAEILSRREEAGRLSDQLAAEVQALRARAASDQEIRGAELRAEISDLRRRWDAADAAVKDLARRIAAAEERQRLGATEAQAREKVEQARVGLELVEQDLARADEERQALELAERMLGPRGARAGLLERAFQVVEQLANAKLARVWPGARIQIARTSETAGGKVREVSRVLGTRPVRPGEEPEEMAEVGRYSTGQLRRVDLALLLARRQVLAASDRNRLALPYLVIDEALNGLDDEGLDGIAALLVEEAKDNLVVVLSHDEKMSRGIPFDQHIQLGAQK